MRESVGGMGWGGVDSRLTQLYTLIGTFITRLTVTALPPSPSPRRQVPTESSYENRIIRPRKVGGSVEGRGSVYVSAGVLRMSIPCVHFVGNGLTAPALSRAQC